VLMGDSGFESLGSPGSDDSRESLAVLSADLANSITWSAHTHVSVPSLRWDEAPSAHAFFEARNTARIVHVGGEELSKAGCLAAGD